MGIVGEKVSEAEAIRRLVPGLSGITDRKTRRALAEESAKEHGFELEPPELEPLKSEPLKPEPLKPEPLKPEPPKSELSQPLPESSEVKAVAKPVAAKAAVKTILRKRISR